MGNKHNNKAFILTPLFFVAFFLLIPELGFASDITSVGTKIQTNVDEIRIIAINVIRVLLLIASSLAVYGWAKNKVEWEQLGKYVIAIIVIGLIAEFINAAIA